MTHEHNDYLAAVESLLRLCRSDAALLELAKEIDAIVRYEVAHGIVESERLLVRLGGASAKPARRTAIISDIHGNHAGLMAVLYDIRQQDCERILCLGDLVEGGPDNEGVVRVLQESNIACVRGNHDENNDVNLSLETRRYLAELPESFAEQDVLYTHISPRDKKRKIDHVIEAWNVFEESSHRLIFVGHAHVPHVFGKASRTYGEASRHPFEYNRLLQLEESDRYVISVGSFGYGRDTAAKIRYCIFDAEAGTVEMRAIDGPLLPLDYSVARFST